MAPTYSEMKAQLQTIVGELDQYKVINKSLQAKVETQKWLKMESKSIGRMNYKR